MYSAIIAKHVSQSALEAAENLGIALARRVIEQGADNILSEAKLQIANEIRSENAERIKMAAEKNGITKDHLLENGSLTAS